MSWQFLRKIAGGFSAYECSECGLEVTTDPDEYLDECDCCATLDDFAPEHDYEDEDA